MLQRIGIKVAFAVLTMLLNKSVNTKAMKENNKNTEAAILEAADKLSRRMDSRGLRPR